MIYKINCKDHKKVKSFNDKDPYWGIKRTIFTGDNNSLLAQHSTRKKTRTRPWWCQDYLELFTMVNKITFRRVVLNLRTECYQRIYLPSWHLRVPRQSQVTISRGSFRPIGFEFHMMLSPSAFSGCGWSVDQLIISCYTVLTRPNKIETAVHDSNSWLSVCPVCPLSFPRSISLASLFSSRLLKHSFTFVRHLSWRKL